MVAQPALAGAKRIRGPESVSIGLYELVPDGLALGADRIETVRSRIATAVFAGMSGNKIRESLQGIGTDHASTYE
jgi:hypothetical protein